MRDRRKSMVFLVLLVGLQLGVLLAFAAQKKGYFIDEIYSWGLSNSYYKPFVDSYDVFGRWVDGELLQNYMTVQPGEGFSYGSVWYNQSQDVHPPFFYLLLHTICSFTPNVYGTWQGMALNVPVYVGCLLMIFLTARLLLGSDGKAMAAMAIWGLSPGGLSTGVYIRMYMLVTFFASVSLYLHVKMMLKGQNGWRLAGICLVTYLGLLTQYYFVFFAFFLSAVYVLGKMRKRRWKEAVVYSAALFGSVGAMALTFPACFAQVTRTDEFVAAETRNNLSTGGMVAINLISYISSINMDFLGGRIRPVAAGSLLAALCCLGKRRMRLCAKTADEAGDEERKAEGREGVGRNGPAGKARKPEVPVAAALTVVLGLCFFSVSWMAVVPGVRYIYNLYPLMAVLAVWWVDRFLTWSLGEGKSVFRARMGILAVAALLFARGYARGYVQYLYPENQECRRLAAMYADRYCLYIDDGKNSPLTQDLIELGGFRGVYVMPEGEIGRVKEVLEGKDTDEGLIVYVDTNEFWSSGYDGETVMEELKEATGLSGYRHLYSHELSETYLLQ